MKYYIDINNKPFEFEDNVTAEIIANVESVHSTTLTEITETDYEAMIAPTLEQLQTAKINELKQQCANQITSGFTSNALGSEYTYQSDQIDQLNLIGVVTAGADDVFKCSPDGVNWAYELHTITQLQQVLADGKTAKQSALARYEQLKVEVNNATTQADLDAIQW